MRLDSEAETITLLGSRGEPLGSVPWEAVIDLIQSSVKEARSHRALRDFPRSRLAAKVRYSTPDNKHFESITCEVGGGGLFIETQLPPEVGSTLELELILPEDSGKPSRRKAKWPGLGLRMSIMCSLQGWESSSLRFPRKGGRAS